MEFVAIIPARYASTRFPGKPLAMLGGKPVIRRVYEQVTGVLPDAVVATDDERILRAVEEFGGRAVMTSSEHRSGTDRCWEAYGKLGREYDAVINVQGDEPFIRPEQLRAIMRCFDVPGTDIATLVRPFAESDGLAALENPNSPKVVLDGESRAIYFSRSVIPYLRGVERSEWLAKHTFYKHIGMYAFRTKVLAEVTALPPASSVPASVIDHGSTTRTLPSSRPASRTMLSGENLTESGGMTAFPIAKRAVFPTNVPGVAPSVLM